MSGLPVPAVAALSAAETLAAGGGVPAGRPAGATFSQVLLDGIDTVNRRVVEADSLVRAFAVDDSIPLHRVTFALEEARLSLELMMQVRARLVESYQRMMEMQL